MAEPVTSPHNFLNEPSYVFNSIITGLNCVVRMLSIAVGSSCVCKINLIVGLKQNINELLRFYGVAVSSSRMSLIQ